MGNVIKEVTKSYDYILLNMQINTQLLYSETYKQKKEAKLNL